MDSNYDTRYFAEHVADPGFRRGAELARLLGTVALRLSESEILPFRYSHFTQRLDEYVTAAARTADSAGQPPMRLDFAPLRSAVALAASQAKVLERRIDDRLATRAVTPSSAARLSDLLGRMEQRLLDEHGSPDTRWYRNVVYGWDIYSLYDGQPFPGLADAIRRGDGAGAARELVTITEAVRRLSQGLSAAGELAATIH